MGRYEGETPASYELQGVKLKHHIRSFLSVAQLVNERHEVHDVDSFLLQVGRTLKRLEADAVSAGWDSDQFDAVRYALCACFDECLLQAGGSRIQGLLQSCSLGGRYFDDYLAGQGFFERLDRARADVRQNRQALEVYLLCLTLGFKGRYQEGEREERQQLIEALQRELEIYPSSVPPLSPNIVEQGQVNGFVRRRIPAWLINVVLVSMAVAFWYACSELLDQQSHVLIDHIEQRWGD